MTDARIPPHNLEAEESLLGAMLLSRSAILSAGEVDLVAADFYKPAHGHIFEAITSLHAQGDPADPVTVADELRRAGLLEGVGGPATLISVQARTPAIGNATRYATIVAEHALLRRLIAAAGDAIEIGYSLPTDVSAALERVRDLIERAGIRLPGVSDIDLSRFAPGGEWVLDLPPGVPAVWGDQDSVLWAEGESCLIVGPPGVGKSSIAQQLVLAMIGCGGTEVLELPVAPAQRVLYLACDRPAQIARGFARAVGPEHREILDDRLSVLKGPPPKDFARHPNALVDMATAVGATVVVVDSLKDVALGLTDDEVGAGVNRCLQTAVAAGLQVLVLHHQRKGQNGSRPRTLEVVYGSTWITAGAGSVVLLWGEAGDLLVRLEHLKQPAAPVGPFDILHDHDACRSTIDRGPANPLVVLRGSPKGITTVDLARLVGEKDQPTKVERQRAQRQLDRLVTAGQAKRIEASTGGTGGSTPARYFAVDHVHEEDLG